MKVAIIGAGISGLCCAIELERHGIEYDIFEQKHAIGDMYSHVGALLELVDRPVKDLLVFLRDKYGIEINSIAPLKKIIHYGPNSHFEITGKLGYLLQRGQDGNSVENTLARRLSRKIQFNMSADYQQLKERYDYVMVATGRDDVARELGVWQLLYPAYIRGATILGNFDPNALIAWVNRDFCRNGYAYLTPFDSRRASLILVVGEVRREEMDHYWNVFLSKINLNVEIVNVFEQEHYSGHVYPHRVGNIYLIGNSAGCVEPFLGFGQYFAVMSGIEAARSIVTGSDYEQRIKPITRRNLEFFELRKAFNILDNRGLDMIIRLLGFFPVSFFIYHTRVDVISLISKLIKLAGRIAVNR